MDPRENLLRIYRELADWYERQHQPQMRDRFLVLAADAALTAGRPDEAESLRLRLLKVNPHHMLKPFGSYAQALKTPDVLTYVKDLRVNYPANVAEDLLRTLQVEAKPAAAPPVPLLEKELFVDEKPPEPARPAPANPHLPQTIPLQGPIPAAPRRTRSPSPSPPGPVAARPGARPRKAGRGTGGRRLLARGPAVFTGYCLRRGAGRLHVPAALSAAWMAAVIWRGSGWKPNLRGACGIGVGARGEKKRPGSPKPSPSQL